MKAAAKPEQRTSLFRRGLNDSFYGFSDPQGNFSWAKFIAVWGQIAVLFHFGRTFDELIVRPESLAIVLAFIICPDVLKKVISAKYGGGEK